MKKSITTIIGVFLSLFYCSSQDYTVFNFDNAQPANVGSWADTFTSAVNPTKDVVNGSDNAGLYTHRAAWSDVSINTPNIDTRIYGSYEIKYCSPYATSGAVSIACFNGNTQLDWFEPQVTAAGVWVKQTRTIAFAQKITRVMIAFKRSSGPDAITNNNLIYFDDFIFNKTAAGPEYTLYNENFAGGFATWEGPKTVAPSTRNGRWSGLINATTPSDIPITLFKSYDLARQSEILLAPSAAITSPGPVVSFSGLDLFGYDNLKLQIGADWAANMSPAEVADFNNNALDPALKTPKIEMQSGTGNWTSIPLVPLRLEGWNSMIQNFDLSNYALGNNVSTLNFRLTSAPNLTTVFYSMKLTGRSVPTISASTSSLSGFSYAYGSGPSANQSFTVLAAGLSADMTITPTAPFEVSTASGSGFTSGTLSISPINGTITTKTIYVRLASGQSVSNYSAKNITISSTGATSQTVVAAGNVTPLAISTSNQAGFTATQLNSGIPDNLLAGTDITVMSGSELTIDKTIGVRNITVSPGAKMTLTNTKNLSAATITLQSDATGTSTFVDGNLSETPTSISNVTVQQYLPFVERNWYLSSPVTTSAFGQINRGNSVIYYDEQNASTTPWPTASGNLTPGKGYISVASSTTGTGSVSFQNGTLNSGSITVPLTRTAGQPKEGFNLVGNPYPSYIAWTADMATAANVLSSVWYRTKVANSYLFYTYNAVSDIAAPSTAGITANIPPMQAFWVRVKAASNGSSTTGTLTFNNSMRSHGSGASNLLKVSSLQNASQQVLRLQVSNETCSDETVILFNPNASNAIDDYDSPKMSNANASISEIYTMVGNENMVINGLKSVSNYDIIPLGFSPGTASSFTIKAVEVKNFDLGTQVLLQDNATNTIQDLTSGSDYNFTAENTIPAKNRFNIIIKIPAITTNVNSVENSGITVSKNAQNKIIVFCNGNLRSGDYVSVCNSIGKKVTEKQLNSNITVLDAQLKMGVYLVTVQMGGICQTTKLIIQ